MSDQIFDVTDLKEKISKLKEAQKQRILERQQVEVKLIEKENLLQRMKQDYTILQPNLELRYHNSTASAAASVVLSQAPSHSKANSGIESNDRSQRPNAVQLDEAIVDKELVDDQRFRIWNDKLEMQILLQEIRQTIPQLEKQAKLYEKQTTSHKKHVLKKEMQNPSAASNTNSAEDQILKPSLLLSPRECQEMIEKTMKEIIDYKVTKRVKIEQQKQANTALVQKLNFVRKEIQQKLTERAALKRIVLKFQKDFLIQKQKAAAVQRDFLELRRVCEEKGQYLWQTAIFTQETGSESGRLSIDRIVPLLSKWIIVNNKKKEIEWTSRDSLKALIREIRLQNQKYLKRGGGESKLPEEEEEEEEGAGDSERDTVDRITFCLLCQHLILRLE